MKKQFNRMRQLANQTVGRAEKTEVLNDDLLQIERRMELVRLVSHNTHKRLVSCLQGQVGTDSEKRHKKLPLMALCQTMQDGGTQLGDESLIGKMMEVCGQAENTLASELMEHELQIEREVLEPLYQLAEVDIPNILKQRKQLSKLVLDYDSARTRWYQATKSSNQAMASKVDSLKDEMEEAHNKVEICKDQLSADMYNFASKDSDYARYYLTLLESQADYHRKSLAALETAIPNIQLQQDSWMEKPAYGTSLEEHLKRSGREIALPIEACVMMLLESGMKEEGLFRIAAGASKLKKLKAALDCSTSHLSEFYSDPHAVAGALKSYLRELPEPLMTFSLYDEWIQASNVSDPDKRLQALWVTCDGLPKNHKANFRYLVKFLARLSQDSDVNKMTASNIAIVLGPNLLWAKTEGTLAEMAAATSVHVVTIIEPIIVHADWFFPEEVEFNVSDMFGPETPDTEPTAAGLDRRRPGSQDSFGGDPSTPTTTPRKDSIVNKHPEPTPRRTGTVIRKQPQQLSSPPSLEAPLSDPPHPQPQPQPLSLQATEAEQPGLGAGGGGGVGGGVGVGQCGGGGGGGGGVVQVLHPLNHLISEEGSPARELTSTPPLQRNGSVYLTPGTPHSQGGSRGPSPHLMRRGTKKQAPAPPKLASPFSNQQQTTSGPPHPQQTPTAASPHPHQQHPAATPRRHTGKDSPIHAPAHPPPQPPPGGGGPHPSPLLHQQGEAESSPRSSTPSPTPADTDTPPPLLLPQNPYPTGGSLPRPARPAPNPKPRPRPNMPPPPQPPAAAPANDGDDDDGGFLGSASKIITDGGLFSKGIGRAFVPVISVDQQGESSAGHEPAPSSSSSLNPPAEAEVQLENTVL